MFTAVPTNPVVFVTSRYTRALGLFHDLNTASMVNISCSCGSSGNVFSCASYTSLYASHKDCKSSAFNSTSFCTFFNSFNFLNFFSKCSCGIPKTTSPNKSSNRRYASYKNRLLDSSVNAVCVNASTTRSFNPRFNTVSIIPGMLASAPERTDKSKGNSSPTKSVLFLQNTFETSSPITSTASNMSSFNPSNTSGPFSK